MQKICTHLIKNVTEDKALTVTGRTKILTEIIKLPYANRKRSEKR